jgi:SAM-dependent methyltransferase
LAPQGILGPALRRGRHALTPWDLGGPSPTLDALAREVGLARGSSLLVPGCGLGHDALHFASLGFDVSAVDWSSTAIEQVRGIARRRSLELELLAGDFWAIPPTWHGSFDAVAEHTFFCAIDPADRARYVELAARLLKPGGRVLGALFVGERPGEPGPPFLAKEDEIRRLFGQHFTIARLEPSRAAVDKRAAIEWAAVFVKR